VPTFFIRVHGFSLRTIGTAAGIISLVVGIPSMILGGWFSDRVRRLFSGGRMAFTASAAVASVPLWIALLYTNNVTLLIAVNVVLYALAIVWVGPATADIVRALFPDVALVELPDPVLPGRARNTGLSAATGDIVTFPGSHVSLLPGALEARRRAIRDEAGIDHDPVGIVDGQLPRVRQRPVDLHAKQPAQAFGQRLDLVHGSGPLVDHQSRLLVHLPGEANANGLPAAHIDHAAGRRPVQRSVSATVLDEQEAVLVLDQTAGDQPLAHRSILPSRPVPTPACSARRNVDRAVLPRRQPVRRRRRNPSA